MMLRKSKLHILLIFIAFLIELGLKIDPPTFAQQSGSEMEIIHGASIPGYTADAFSPSGNAYLYVDTLANYGVNTISLVVNWYQDEMDSTLITRDARLTVRDDDLKALIKYIHAQELDVMLKPHLEIRAGGWRGEIEPSDDTAWFESYADFQAYYAALAQETGVELFCIGTEQESMTTPGRIDGWDLVIDRVREVYTGAVTYSGTVGEIDNVKRPRIPTEFWDKLNYAAITIYLRLSDDPTPTLQTLNDQWQGWVLTDVIRPWQATHGKPVIFGEIGYRSVSATAMSPWLTWGHNFFWDPATMPEPVQGEMAYDGVGQANAYQAFLENTASEAWFAGAFLWQFDPYSHCQVVRGGEGDIGYSVIGKPAGQVISHFWNGEAVPVFEANIHQLMIDAFDYENPESAAQAWQVRTTGTVSYQVGGDERGGLTILSSVPYDVHSYMQMVYTPCTGLQDWSAGQAVGFSIKLEDDYEDIYGGEVTLALVDGGEEQPEVWEYSQWVESNGEWQNLCIPLQSDPSLTSSWEGVFTVNDYRRDPQAPTNLRFETNVVWQVWLTIKTTNDDAQKGYTDLEATVADLQILDSLPPDCLPTAVGNGGSLFDDETHEVMVDAFAYTSLEEASEAWRINASGPVSFQVTDSVSPDGLRVVTSLPRAASRYMQIMKTLDTELQNWAGAEAVQFRVKLEEAYQNSYGGEVTIGLMDGSEEQPEVWEYSQWVESGKWQNLCIPLRGDPALLSSWNGAFAVNEYRRDPNNVTDLTFDLTHLREVWLTFQTTQEDAGWNRTDLTATVADLAILDYVPEECWAAVTGISGSSIYSQPDPGLARFDYINRNERVRVLGTNADRTWYHVRHFRAGEGWIPAGELNIYLDAAELPIHEGGH